MDSSTNPLRQPTNSWKATEAAPKPSPARESRSIDGGIGSVASSSLLRTLLFFNYDGIVKRSLFATSALGVSLYSSRPCSTLLGAQPCTSNLEIHGTFLEDHELFSAEKTLSD